MDVEASISKTFLKLTKNKKRVYFGASDTSFKERYRNRTRDFNHERYSKCKELSKYIWQLKRNKKSLVLNGELLEKYFAMQKEITVYCV